MKNYIQNLVHNFTLNRVTFYFLALILSSIHVAAALSGEYKVLLILYPILVLVLVINAIRSEK